MEKLFRTKQEKALIKATRKAAKEGRMEGRIEGRIEGRAEARAEVMTVWIRNGLAQGHDPQSLATIFGVSEDEVLRLSATD